VGSKSRQSRVDGASVLTLDPVAGSNRSHRHTKPHRLRIRLMHYWNSATSSKTASAKETALAKVTL
jgi:hypothetical protein